ncbi:MAG: PAS domain S-box protein [bacterium]
MRVGRQIRKIVGISTRYTSPFYFLIIVAISIFFAEMFVMFILAIMPLLSPLTGMLFDSSLLVVLLFPALYYFLLRPLIRHTTECKQAQERFRLVVESAPNSIVMVNPEGKIVLVNSQTEKMFGYSRAELIGQPVEMLLPERFRRQHVKHRQAYLVDPKSRQIGVDRDLFGLRKDGQELPVYIGLSPIETTQGVSVLSMIVDMSEHKQAEKALRKSEEKYRILFDNANDSIFIIDPKTHHFLDVNENAAKRLGYTREELLQLTIDDIDTAQTAMGNDSIIRELLEKGSVVFEHAHRRKDGTEMPVEISSKVINYAGRKVFQSYVRDITERKRVEELIKNQNVLLEQAFQEKQHEMELLMERLIRQEKLAAIGQISGSIAHELRNPLGAIKQSIFFLNRLYQNNRLESSNSKVKEHFELLETEIDTSDRVISDLLQMTKIEPLQKEQMNLRSVILEAAEICHIENRIQIKLELNPEPFLMWADSLQLRQVFINLLSNAVHAISQKGVVTINAKMLHKDKKCLITMQDNGHGMDSKYLGKVFEPLFTTKAKGTGLGLSICKQIIENHGGSITLSSQVHRGTTVNIELPCEFTNHKKQNSTQIRKT